MFRERGRAAEHLEQNPAMSLFSVLQSGQVFKAITP